ncbi:MAG: hypothetical protein JXA20_07400 [Spirochaetes bacterium]|nr:hypothetical protein [Spirochaetota bacterium]
MGNGSEIDGIISRSEKIRAGKKRERERISGSGKRPEKKEREAGALRIWFINYSTPVIFLGIPMLILMPIFAVAVSASDGKSGVIALVIGGILSAGVLYLVIHFLRTFPVTYRAWHYRPDYPVVGMDGLYGEIGRDFWRNDAEHWIDCGIGVKLKGEAPEAARAFNAALVIFAAEANAAFYGASEADAGRDPRKEWVQERLLASGSADGRVLFRMKKFLCGELAAVAHHFRNDLDSVTIIRGPGSFSVSRARYSGEGTAS